MLKHRILTALILVPLVLGGIFYLPTQQLGYALVFFVVVGAWEWARIVGVHSPVARIIYAAFVGAILLALSFKPVEKELLLWLFAAVVLWWCVNFVRIAAYRGELGFRKTELGLDLFNGILLLIPTWLGFLFLHGHASKGIEQIVVLMLIIWGADTGAYFAGRCFGKHKLAPKVSPGKTWEGVAGASVVTIVVAIGSLYWLQIESAYTLYFILLCIVTMVVSILGDLYESLYKRRAQIKDSGAIFPGHGGVLDRIDSMTAAAPMFSIGLLLLGV